MQLIRQVLGIGVFPIMIEAFDRLRTRQGHPDPGDAKPGEGAKRVKSKQKSVASTVAALAVAVIAGALGKASGIPGLTFTASIVAVSVLKLAFDFAFIPKVVKKACQLLAGCYRERCSPPRFVGTSQPHRARAHPYRGIYLELLRGRKA